MDRTVSLETWSRERLAAVGHPWPGLPPKPEDIVVGVDGSDESMDAVAWAARLGGHVHLVHATIVREPPVTPAMVHGTGPSIGIPSPTREEVFAPAGRVTMGLPTTSHLVADEPAHGVERTARDVGAPLVAVGHVGKSFLERSVLGSVSEHLAHKAPQSVLVARGEPRDGPIVAAVGDDPGTEYATAWATAIADRWDRRLILVHSVPEGTPRSGFPGTGPDAYAADVPWPPKTHLRDVLRDEDAALLVVGHGRRPGWLGSTAVHMVRYAPTSVLVARHWSR